MENNAPARTDGSQLVSNNVVEQLVALRRYEAKIKSGKQIVTFAQPYAPELVSASRFFASLAVLHCWPHHRDRLSAFPGQPFAGGENCASLRRSPDPFLYTKFR